MKSVNYSSLLSCLLILSLSCSKPPTPAPATPGPIPLRVFVVRDWLDSGLPAHERLGYGWEDSQITELLNDFFNKSYIVAGQPISFSWPTGVREILLDLSSSGHWLPYRNWIEYLQAHPEYHEGALNIFFIPGLIDNEEPWRFMDTYTLDPAHNNDPYWDTHDWKRMILISDCRVYPGVTEHVEHDDEWVQGIRMVPVNQQKNHYMVHHAIERYFLRRDGVGPLFDFQENRTGGIISIMRRWDFRADEQQNHRTSPYFQGEVEDKINSPGWNDP
jgi:hypothetical protein